MRKKMVKQRFKEDGKTRRCFATVDHAGVDSLGFGQGYSAQCQFAAGYDKNTRCKVHSKAGLAARKAKTIKREVAKAKALLRKHRAAK